MEELEAQSQPPSQEFVQAETLPQAGDVALSDSAPAENSLDEVPEEIVAMMPVRPVFSQEQLADEVAASNIKVIWRGGIRAGAILAFVISLVINIGVATAMFFVVMYGIWVQPKQQQREYGVYVGVPEEIQDGGSAGGVGKAGDPNLIADVKSPSLENLINTNPSADLLGPVDNAGENNFAAIESGEKLNVIALGTGGAPRALGKPKGGGNAKAGEAGGGTGGTAGSGFGGNGNGSGSGSGEGVDLGLSMDTQVRILDGPKLSIPMAYLTGTVKLDQPPLIRVWVKANNKVDRVELVRSSGDSTFDSIVMEHYRRQKYLAATEDGEPVEKSIEVSYELSGMGKKS